MGTRDGSAADDRTDPGRRSESAAVRGAVLGALGALLALSLSCATASRGGRGGAPGAGPDTSAFVVTLGTDTIMAERYVVDRQWTEGDLVDRSPTTSLLHYEFAADPRGHLRRFDATVSSDSARSFSVVSWTLHVQRMAGGFDVTVRAGKESRHSFVKGSADAIPLVARSIGIYRLVTRRLRDARADSLVVPILDTDSMRVTSSFVRAIGRDSVMVPLIFPRGEHARVDSAGRILGVSGLATSYQWRTERVSDLDVAGLARSFADRDAGGGALGSYSSRDTARAVIDGVHLAIDYGRPSRRGRVIFGGVVPWGEVWRTGADLATHLTIDRDLVVGDLPLAAGTYTLYSLPSRDGWKLIVNRRTGQSGLRYDSTADVGRVAMRSRSSATTTERFTITVEPGAAGGVLRMAWDDWIGEVPLRGRKSEGAP